MKQLTPSLLLLFSCNILFGQKTTNDIFYLWDSAWNNVPKVENAIFFTRVRYVNDTCWQHHNYKIGGPMLTLEEYKDRDAKVPHGRFSYMDKEGRLDSTGFVVDGKVHGTWYFFSDTASVVMTKEYSHGKLMVTRIVSDPEKEEKNDVESEYPGPAGSRSRYLIKNFTYPPAALSRGIQGTVIVSFAIGVDGRVQDEFLSKSVEFTVDDEAVRLIKQSPKWIPATQNGQKVKTYKRQQIQFRF